MKESSTILPEVFWFVQIKKKIFTNFSDKHASELTLAELKTQLDKVRAMEKFRMIIIRGLAPSALGTTKV